MNEGCFSSRLLFDHPSSIHRMMSETASKRKSSPLSNERTRYRREDIDFGLGFEGGRENSFRRTKLKRKGRGDVKRKAGREKSVVGRQKGRERNLADRAPVTGRRLTDVFQFARPFTDRQKRSLFCKLQIAAAVSQVLPGKTHRQRYFSPRSSRTHRLQNWKRPFDLPTTLNAPTFIPARINVDRFTGSLASSLTGFP